MRPSTVFTCILLTCDLYRVIWSSTLKPLIRPNKNEIEINVGDSITFECTYSGNIFFFSPEYKQTGQKIVATLPQKVEPQADGNYTYFFSRKHAMPNDTGWYGCANQNTTITSEIFDDPKFSWIYFYVSSPNLAFIEEDVFKVVTQISGHAAILPCRPTSRNLKVVLQKMFPDEEVHVGGNVSYDPKFGFKLENLKITDSSPFKCSSMMNGMLHEVTYELFVQRNAIVDYLKIDDNELEHVVSGQNLHLNCTMYLESGGGVYTLNWTTPHQSSRISARSYTKDIKGGIEEVVKELIIKNVTVEDMGEYTCYVTIRTYTNQTKIFLKVHDPKEKYMKLIPQNPNVYYERPRGEKVRWIVRVRAYPEPELKWLLPNGHQIMSNRSDKKYIIKKTKSSTSLTITNLEVLDTGVYQLRSTNSDNIEKSLNFTLEVSAKPFIKLKSVARYYTPGRIASIQCEVTSSSRPDIVWNFQRRLNYPTMENSSFEKLQSEMENPKPYFFLSKTSIKINISGIVYCTACNKNGCESVSESICASDVNGGFGLLQPKERIIEGDNIRIVCMASICNSTKNITWTKGDDKKPIVNNGNIIVREANTSFTYSSTLSIQRVRKEDAALYICSVKPINGSLKIMKYNLTVYDEKPPKFTNSSLNGTDLTIYLGEERHNVITLMCYVDGSPKPNVTWYKDGVPLKNRNNERKDGKDQYLFFNNNQELRINYLLQKDSGQYSCRATNRLKTIEDFINIVIKGKELSKGLISMIIVLFIIVAILMVYVRIKIRREKKLRKELLKAGLMHFEKGALQCLNPALTVDDQAELLPYDKKWEFPKERLKLGKKLGSGAFGVVMKAEAHGICKGEAVTTVAVKMVRRATDRTYVRALVSELKIMVHLGKHLNVVNLLGACTKNISKCELLVIVEYCCFGNLHDYLLNHKANFINQIDPATGKFDFMIGADLLTKTTNVTGDNSISANSKTKTIHNDTFNASDSIGVTTALDDYIGVNNNSSQPGWCSNYRGDCKDQNSKLICTQDLLSWAFQVARGMEYLSQRKILHGDLAARNILLAEDNVVKICDFGLSKTMYKDSNYKKNGNEPLPIKWMAIESIRDRIFSTQSDIWSFGIVLWEFFTLSKTPYPGIEVEAQCEKLIDGYRLEQPAYSTNELYQIMMECWKAEPTSRPSFTELVDRIGNLLEENVKTHYISLNAPYVSMNTEILKGKDDYLTMMSAPDHSTFSSPTNGYMNLAKTDNVPESGYLSMSPTTNTKEEFDIFSPRSSPE